MRDTGNVKRIGRFKVDGAYGADCEEGEAVEGNAGTVKLVGQVMDPGEEEVGDDAIRWVLLHELLDGGLEHGDGMVDLGEVADVVNEGGEAFDAVGEAQFLGGEGNGVEAEGGDGFANDLGVDGGGDDSGVVAARGEERGYVAERDHVTCCWVMNEVEFEWFHLRLRIYHFNSLNIFVPLQSR